MERAVVTVRLAVLSHASGGGDVIVRKLDSQGGRSVYFVVNCR